MKSLRLLAAVFLMAVALCAVAAPWLAPHSYAEQSRQQADAPPSPGYPLGTDQLGRDRFSRLLYATAVSVILAPAAAAVSMVIAFALSLLGMTRMKPLRFGLSTLTALTLSIPWIFPFIVLRAVLPLNTSPGVSVVLTFALIGVAGWAYPGRVLTSAIQEISGSEWLLLARASGISPWRTFRAQILPHLWSVAGAQFRAMLPAYILSEASLGLLGLGVAEPLPSWGNMLLELRHLDRVRANPAIAVPLLLLIAVMICLELLGTTQERIA